MSEEEVHRVMHVCHREAEVGTEGRKRNYSGVGGAMGGDGSEVGEMRTKWNDA